MENQWLITKIWMIIIKTRSASVTLLESAIEERRLKASRLVIASSQDETFLD